MSLITCVYLLFNVKTECSLACRFFFSVDCNLKWPLSTLYNYSPIGCSTPFSCVMCVPTKALSLSPPWLPLPVGGTDFSWWSCGRQLRCWRTSLHRGCQGHYRCLLWRQTQPYQYRQTTEHRAGLTLTNTPQSKDVLRNPVLPCPVPPFCTCDTILPLQFLGVGAVAFAVLGEFVPPVHVNSVLKACDAWSVEWPWKHKDSNSG